MKVLNKKLVIYIQVILKQHPTSLKQVRIYIGKIYTVSVINLSENKEKANGLAEKAENWKQWFDKYPECIV